MSSRIFRGWLLLRARQRALIAGLSGQRGVDIVHTFVHERLFDPHFGPSLLVLPSLVHGVLYCRRHDFAAWIVGVVERSGFSGNVFGGICDCGARSVDRGQVCGIRTLLPQAVLVLLIRKACP
ncbi:hypothetical protein Arth_1695 [Arthrobacter sp. FB24]|nr:hypothetical protein Arth_1695 [Arthrobacter sp. FB24]